MPTRLANVAQVLFMQRQLNQCFRFAIILIFSSLAAGAQTPTYHLHDDANGIYLSAAAPDAAATTLYSQDLKSLNVGEYQVQQFLTPTGVPGNNGVIPGGTTVSFTLWMRKTANKGTMYPRAKVFLNSTAADLLGQRRHRLQDSFTNGKDWKYYSQHS